MEYRNPFVITGYQSPEEFCDRENETNRLQNAVENGRNLTLISWRRMGKTGLIHHLFYRLSQEKKRSCFYVDLMPTEDLPGFIRVFADAVLGKLDKKPQKIITSLGKVFRRLRPVVSFDGMTGEPAVTFDLVDRENPGETLEEVFQYLRKHDGQIVIALDEFQQIEQYPEKNTESLLRSFIQSAPNLTFIFSGSKKHLLSAMFRDTGRPFFSSTEILDLGTIDQEQYTGFISSRFEKAGKKISHTDIQFVLDFCMYHTWYIQFAFNRLFSFSTRKYDSEIVRGSLVKLLEEQSPIYYSYRNLLSSFQWQVMVAIASEQHVKEPYGKSFISKHALGTPSSVKAAITALESKEMVLSENGVFRVYDVFLSRFLERVG